MFVSNVQPYEEMKLRMLNGGHSFLAYNGSLAGYEFIWQCMEDADFRSITRQLMINEQARTLNPDLNIDAQEYADLLIERFSNRNVAHRTGQIAMDGSQSFPACADALAEIASAKTKQCCSVTARCWLVALCH